MMNASRVAIRNCLQPLLLGALLLGAISQAAVASVVLTNSRAAIGPGFTVDWGTPGPDLTPLSSPFTQGPVTVSGASAFSIFSGATYNADFLSSDWVLSLFDLNTLTPLPGSFTIDFAAPVMAAGAQVQANSFLGAFSGTISAFNSASFLLGSFNVNGANNGNGDGSAVFAGIISTAADIKELTFTGFGDGAGINRLSAGTNGVVTVPEPNTALLALMAALALLFATGRRGRLA